MKNCLWMLVLCCLAIACSRAPTNQPADASEPQAINSVDVVKAKPEELTINAGESGEAVVRLQISKGYHVNANPPTFSYLIPTQLELAPADGIAVEFVKYPDALTKTFPFAEKPLAVYEGETIVKARLKADKTTKPGTHNLSAKLRVQACDDKVCYAPGAIDLVVPVTIK